MERTNGEYGAAKNFVFDLKRRLDTEIYDFLWRKINLPRISSRSCRHRYSLKPKTYPSATVI